MVTDGTLHAVTPVAGTAAVLVERFTADPQRWLPSAWAEGWVSLATHRTRVPARCSFGPPVIGPGSVRRTVLLDPHGGRAAAPGFAGSLELRADERGACLVLRARYRYAHPQAGPDEAQCVAHEAAVRWLVQLGAGLARAAADADGVAAARAAHPAGGRRRFGRLRLVPG
jgi:hypothetical protein